MEEAEAGGSESGASLDYIGRPHLTQNPDKEGITPPSTSTFGNLNI